MKLSTLLPAFLLAIAFVLPARAFALPAEFAGSVDDFYQLPATIPAGAAGTVVRWKTFDASPILTTGADPVKSYRMMYISTGARGERTLVTGTVLIPVRLHFTGGARPIIGFATGTQGMADRCAAVHGIANSTNYDLAYMRRVLDEGFALGVADYQGLGPKTDRFQGGRADEHTQVVGQTLGRNVLDSVRATREFAGVFDTWRKQRYPEKFVIFANLSLNSKVVFWGYSEGGSAAAWAAELAPTYARELKFVGVAAGGVPADIYKVGTAINTLGSRQNFSFGVLVAAGIGFKAAYPELTLETELNDAGLQLISDVKKQCLIEFIINNFGGKTLSQFMKPRINQPKFDVFTDPTWLARFEENKLGKAPPTMPVYLYQARDDQALEYCQARQLAKTYCARGVYVTWQPISSAIPGVPAEHVAGWTAGLDGAFNFVKSRLGGGTTANSCAALNNADAYCPGQ